MEDFMNTTKKYKVFIHASLILSLVVIPLRRAQAVEPGTAIAAASLVIEIGNEIKNIAAKDATAQVVVKSKTNGPDGNDIAINGDSDTDNWIWEGSLDTDYLKARAEAAQIEHHFAAGELHYKFTSGKGWRPNPGAGFTGKNDTDGWHGVAVAYPDSTPVAGSDNKTEAATVGAFLWNGAVEFAGYKDESGKITEVTNTPNSGHHVVIGQRYTLSNFIIEDSASGKKEISYAQGDQTVQLHNSTIGWNGSSLSYSNVASDLASVTSTTTEFALVEELANSVESEFNSTVSGLNGASAGSFMTVANIALNFTTLEYDNTFTDQELIEMYLTDSLGVGEGASSDYIGPSFLTTQLLEVGDSFDTSMLLTSEELEVADYIAGCENFGTAQADHLCFWAITDENLFVNALNNRLDTGSGDLFNYISGLGTGMSNQFTLDLNYGTADSFFAYASNNAQIGPVPEPSSFIYLLMATGFFFRIKRNSKRDGVQWFPGSSLLCIGKLKLPMPHSQTIVGERAKIQGTRPSEYVPHVTLPYHFSAKYSGPCHPVIRTPPLLS
ncbi:MAG: hypothetical protein ACXWCG_07310 [Flavitalea sp.]